MDRYLGQVATIVKVNERLRTYDLDIDKGEFTWSHEWLMPPPA
jgi:hypothetical protein